MKKVSAIPESIRAEMDGKGAEPQTFAAWMHERTDAEQNQLFGERAAARWRAGQTITQTELFKQNGNELHLSRFTG